MWTSLQCLPEYITALAQVNQSMSLLQGALQGLLLSRWVEARALAREPQDPIQRAPFLFHSSPFSPPSSPPATAVFLLRAHGAHSCLGAWPLCCVAGVSFPRGQSALILSPPRVFTQWVFSRPPYLRLNFSLPGSLYLLFLLSFYPENFIFYHSIYFSHVFVWRLTYPITISLMRQEFCITHCFEQLLLRLLNE